MQNKKNSMKMFRTKALTWMTFLLLVCTGLVLLPNTESIYKKSFSDGSSERIITFPSGGGINDTINVSIRHGIPIIQARVNLTTQPLVGEYPSNLYLDVGVDNDFEWAFSGTGYGNLGRQNIFNDNSQSFNFQFTSPGESSTKEIALPKNAVINGAYLNVSGEFKEFSNKKIIDSNLPMTYNCKLGDIDGDNDLDAIVTHRQQTPFGYPILWFNNTNGDGSAWSKHTIAGVGQINLPYGLAVGDIDQDNDLDVVVADNIWNTKKIFWYNNTNGDGSSWTKHTIESSLSSTTQTWMYEIFLADMNNDTSLDVMATLYNADNSLEDIMWYANENNGNTWTKTNITKTIPNVFGLFVYDIDRDGDNDTAVTTRQNNQVIWLSNENGLGTSWSSPYVIDNSLSLAYSLSIGDLDRDNNPDIAALSSGSTVWYEAPDNPKTGSWPKHTIGPGVGGGWWNGGNIAIYEHGIPGNPEDNYLDVVIAGETNADVLIFKNDGTPVNGGWETINLNTDHIGAKYLAVGDISGDSFNDTLVSSAAWTTVDDLVWYNLTGGIPSNVRLDLGTDAQADWIEPGTLNTTVKIPDFKNNLTLYMAQGSSYFDEYGTELVKVPLKVRSATPGVVTINDLEIIYDLSITVDINPHGNLASELTEALKTIPPDTSANSTVPFKFISDSGGKLLVSDLVIEYNEFPWFISELPEVIYLDEDSKDLALLDLSIFMEDDYLGSTELDYNISYVSGPGADRVTLGIYNHHLLGADAFTGWENDNWTGYLDFSFNVTDNFDITTESELIRLVVTPLNDEPILGSKEYPDMILAEGKTSNPLDLDAQNYFIDIDDDRLYFSLSIDPENKFKNENLSYDLDGATNTVTFTGHGDWFGENVMVRVYCDDSVPVDKTLYKEFELNVVNINDRPVWEQIPDVVIDEDLIKPDAVNLVEYIYDIDDSIENITFSIIDNTNPQAVRITIGENNRIDIYPLLPEFTGLAVITVRATDLAKNYSDTSFKIIYRAVNDLPIVSIITPKDNSVIPSRSVILTWEASDIDTPKENLTYTVFFGDSNPPPQLPDGKDITETQYIISDLEDKMIHYCRILASDGISSSFSEIITFEIDLNKQPQVKLVSPIDNSTFIHTTITFDWVVLEAGGQDLTYNLYLATTNDPLTDTDVEVYSGLTTTELTLVDLKVDQTYYWTVIPWFDIGQGICENGVFKFNIDPSKTEYGLELRSSESEIKLTQGEAYTFNVDITNLGANEEIILITITPKNLSNSITHSINAGRSNEISLGKEASKQIELTIDTTNIVKGKYTMTINAESRITPAKDQASIALEIVKPKSKSDETMGLFNSYYDLLPIILMIIITIVILILIIRHKPKDEPISQELVSEKSVEILYKPPMDAIGRPAWQPQIAGRESVPAMQPYSEVGAEIPKLPPQTDYLSSGSESPLQELQDFQEPFEPELGFDQTEPEPGPYVDVDLDMDHGLDLGATETFGSEVGAGTETETGPKVLLPEDLDIDLGPDLESSSAGPVDGEGTDLESDIGITSPDVVMPKDAAVQDEADMIDKVELPKKAEKNKDL